MPQEPKVEGDNLSDPAHDDEEGQDWSAEGGATAEGPATDVPDNNVGHSDAHAAGKD